jgi:pfkB family carbohydrate kinase
MEEEAAVDVFVVGDLCMDYIATGVTTGGITAVPRVARVGGSAFNAASAFATVGFPTSIFGRVGRDPDGDAVLAAINERGVRSFIDRSERNPTCVCNIVFPSISGESRTIYYWRPNANEYDEICVAVALREAALTPQDLVFTSLHIHEQTGRDAARCGRFFAALAASPARLVVDLVPHRIYEALSIGELKRMVGVQPHIYIGEFRTFMNFVDPGCKLAGEPSASDRLRISDFFPADLIVCRYGIGEISVECVFSGRNPPGSLVLPPAQTGYERVADEAKPGFGDRLTAQTLLRLESKRVV